MTFFEAQSLYFGKLPSNAEFMRSSAGSALSLYLDTWLTQALELLAKDPQWKTIYNAAAPIDFAIFTPNKQAGLVGHWVASYDSAGRCFPFVAAASFEMAEPARFVAQSPQILAPAWSRLGFAVLAATQAPVLTPPLQAALTMPLAGLGDFDQTLYQQFIQEKTLADIEALLPLGEQEVSVRKMLLALGFLLQPMYIQGAHKTIRTLALLLPTDPHTMHLVAMLWMDLIAGFCKNMPHGLCIFITTHLQQPTLLVGLEGASAMALSAAIDPAICQREGEDLSRAEWMENSLDGNPGLRYLSNALLDPGVSVASAVALFHKTFFGE
jgi:type VI secretion system protein ImpM